LDIADAARAEGEVVAAHDVTGAQALQQHLVDEVLRGDRGERGIEALRQHRLNTALLEQPHLGRQQGEAERPGVGHEEAARMRLEGQRHQRGTERARLLRRALDQRLVALVHAVEIAQRDRPAGPLRRDGLPIVEDWNHLAASPRGTRISASPSITTLSPFKHWVLSVTRRRRSSISVTVAMAVMVSPMRTGAMKFIVCET